MGSALCWTAWVLLSSNHCHAIVHSTMAQTSGNAVIISLHMVGKYPSDIFFLLSDWRCGSLERFYPRSASLDSCVSVSLRRMGERGRQLSPGARAHSSHVVTGLMSLFSGVCVEDICTPGSRSASYSFKPLTYISGSFSAFMFTWIQRAGNGEWGAPRSQRNLHLKSTQMVIIHDHLSSVFHAYS